MIKNFKTLEDKVFNFTFAHSNKRHLYKVIEAWEEVYANEDWHGIARFKKVHDTDLEILPVEFSVTLIFHKPMRLFNPIIKIEKYGKLINTANLHRSNVETMNSWFGAVDMVVKNSTELLETVF
jgi:hypothetical protein